MLSQGFALAPDVAVLDPFGERIKAASSDCFDAITETSIHPLGPEAITIMRAGRAGIESK
jgi:hypothetical protein